MGNGVSQLKVKMERYFDILERKPAIAPTAGCTGEIKGRVRFEDVCFRYVRALFVNFNFKNCFDIHDMYR
jgi:ABC-type multidrug transport system fused ATPase/permease subunit